MKYFSSPMYDFFEKIFEVFILKLPKQSTYNRDSYLNNYLLSPKVQGVIKIKETIMQGNKHCGRFDGKVLIPAKVYNWGCARHENVYSQLRKQVNHEYLRLSTDSSVFGKANVGIKIGLLTDRVAFAKINNRSIMDWDGTRVQVRFHSGRTDSNGGHNDYKNISGLGAYHYHSGLPPHSYESSVKNKLSSGLDKFIKDIKAEFDYYISQVTDSERRESLIIGMIAGIAQNILKSGLDITEALVVITDLASSCFLTDNTSRIVDFFDNAESWLSEPIDNLEDMVPYHTAIS